MNFDLIHRILPAILVLGALVLFIAVMGFPAVFKQLQLLGIQGPRLTTLILVVLMLLVGLFFFFSPK